MPKARYLFMLTLLVCMLGSSATSASAFFKVKAETQLKGKGGTQTFTAGSAITCTGVTGATAFKAPQLESSQITVHPEYGKEAEGKCEIPGIGAATITTTGCNYNFHQAKGATIGQVSIECQTGKSLEVKSATCTVSLTGGQGRGQENQFLNSITYSNISKTPKSTEDKANLEGAKFTSSGCLGIVPEKGVGIYKGTISTESTGGTADVEIV